MRRITYWTFGSVSKLESVASFESSHLLTVKIGASHKRIVHRMNDQRLKDNSLNINGYMGVAQSKG